MGGRLPNFGVLLAIEKILVGVNRLFGFIRLAEGANIELDILTGLPGIDALSMGLEGSVEGFHAAQETFLKVDEHELAAAFARFHQLRVFSQLLGKEQLLMSGSLDGV
jgi:hypothetical protein